jgi:quercetin dioxygenase-like cupin family protein
MTMDIDELVALDAAGALPAVEEKALRDRLAQADNGTIAAAAAVYSAAEAIAASAPSASPAPYLRERLLARLRPGFGFVSSDEGWVPHAIPGITVKILSEQPERGYVTMLMRVKPGTVFPGHRHAGPEECYVISGDVTVAGRRLGPGDFHHAEGGTTHGTLSSEHGATVLLVVAAADYH